MNGSLLQALYADIDHAEKHLRSLRNTVRILEQLLEAEDKPNRPAVELEAQLKNEPTVGFEQ
jgi:hypothetical protein